MRAWKAVAAVTAVMTVAAVGAGTAGAAQRAGDLGTAGGVRYLGHNVTLQGAPSGHTTAEATVTCPAEWDSVSGGASVAPGKSRALARLSRSGTNAWKANAWQTSASATKLRVFGICMNGEELTPSIFSLNEIPAGPRNVEVTRWCTTGAVVGGSGRPSGAIRDWRLRTSLPVDSPDDPDTVPDDGWRVSYTYTGSSETSLEVEALCIGGAAPTYARKTVTVRANRAKTTQLACPTDRRVVSGGAGITGGSLAVRVSATRPFDSGDAGTVPEDGWRTTYTNTSGKALQATIHTICVSARS